jgi:hypothetical protein
MHLICYKYNYACWAGTTRYRILNKITGNKFPEEYSSPNTISFVPSLPTKIWTGPGIYFDEVRG